MEFSKIRYKIQFIAEYSSTQSTEVPRVIGHLRFKCSSVSPKTIGCGDSRAIKRKIFRCRRRYGD